MAFEIIDMNQITNIMVNYGIILLALIVTFLAGYIIGYMVSKVFSRILLIDGIQNTLVKLGATTTKLWQSIVTLIEHYVIWWIVLFAVNSVLSANYQVTILGEVLQFLTNVGWFIVLTVIGLLLGGALYKLVKDSLEAIGLEAELEKHKISDSFGGASLSGIFASIVKWYVFLIFLTTGLQILLGLTAEVSSKPILVEFLEDFVRYIPNAVLGIVVILAALIVAVFVTSKVRQRDVAFADLLALGIEVIIIFFGIVLALPKLFNVDDPGAFKMSLSLLVDSFKLIVAGISIGLAIAVGLGLKDSIAKASKDMK